MAQTLFACQYEAFLGINPLLYPYYCIDSKYLGGLGVVLGMGVGLGVDVSKESISNFNLLDPAPDRLNCHSALSS